jgi:hypothetical protein
MNTYQKHLFKLFEEFRQPPAWPNYPPYKEGDYFEEYFIKYFQEVCPKTKRYFIPVAWSSCYINNRDTPLPKLQDALSSLKQDEEYFMVGVHDDAPREMIPPNTMKFLAGGNKGDKNTIPIPVVVNKIPPRYLKNVNYEKTYMASFVGSMTHPFRRQMYEKHQNTDGFLFQLKQWSPLVVEEQLKYYLQASAQSHFVLCPRGYAPTSCRLYETMQLNAVPVYISDQFWLPWADQLDWRSICVFIKPDEIGYLDLILKDCMYSDDYDLKLKEVEKIYDNFFTFDAMVPKIMEKVNI